MRYSTWGRILLGNKVGSPKLFLLLIVVVLHPTQATDGALLGHDPFNYDTGAVLNELAGGTGWDGPWFSEDAVTVEDRTLVFGDQTGAPKAALITGVDFMHMMSRPFAAVDDTLYISMLLRAEVYDDFIQLQVSDGATGNSAETMTVGLDARNPIGFYARTGTSGQGSSFSEGATLEIETDYFLVGKFSKDGGDTYNRVDFFVDPGDTEPEFADAVREGVDTGLGQLSLFTVRTALMEGDEEVFIDELRVGTTYNDVLLAGVELPDPGDFNADGVIDRADYDIMRANFKEPGGFSEGDLNFDGEVNLVDFGLFVPIYAAANPAQAQAVPEPASALLALGGLLMLLTRRRR